MKEELREYGVVSVKISLSDRPTPNSQVDIDTGKAFWTKYFWFSKITVTTDLGEVDIQGVAINQIERKVHQKNEWKSCAYILEKKITEARWRFSDYILVSEIAEKLRVSEMTIYRYIKAGRLEAYKFGKEFRVTKEAFEKFLNHHEV